MWETVDVKWDEGKNMGKIYKSGHLIFKIRTLDSNCKDTEAIWLVVLKKISELIHEEIAEIFHNPTSNTGQQIRYHEHVPHNDCQHYQ